jgi:hypothetical protein
VKDTDAGVFVPLEYEQAIDTIKRAMVPEQRELGTDEGSRVEVEEADVPTQLAISRIEAMTLGEHHPAARVESQIGDAAAARTEGAGPPTGADGAEANVIQEIALQNKPRYQAKQISRKDRRPWRERKGRRHGSIRSCRRGAPALLCARSHGQRARNLIRERSRRCHHRVPMCRSDETDREVEAERTFLVGEVIKVSSERERNINQRFLFVI